MERVLAFLPSMLIIGGIAAVTAIYLRWICKRFGDNLQSVEWQQKNRLKVMLLVSSPFLYLKAPALEELVFRAPLIIAFSSVTANAWYGILVSGALFAAAHWFGNKIQFTELESEKEDGKNQSDNVEEEIQRLAKNKKNVLRQRILHVIFTFPLGVLIGYYGVKFQSLWVSFGIHALWNIFMPLIFPLIVAVLYILFLLCLTPFVWVKQRFFSKKNRHVT